MRIHNILSTAVLILASALPTWGQQHDAPSSYWYAELQGGIQWTTTNAKIDKLLTPTAALSVGHYFTPQFGMRLHVNGPQAKSGIESPARYWKWNYLTGNVDLMLNLSNTFSKQKHHPLNVILLAGIGAATGWGNDDYRDLVASGQMAEDFGWDQNRTFHNVRGGLRLETDTRKTLGLSLEVNANHMEDRWNSKSSAGYDWMLTAMLGVSLRFGKHYKNTLPAPVPVVEQPAVVSVAPVPAVVEEKKPEPVVAPKPATIHEEIHYVICGSEPSDADKVKLQRVAQFMQDNPSARVTIVGYADRGTGNARLNMRYSEQRAARTKDLLVNHYGADAKRITTDAKGDSIQPFSDNDANRVTIIDGSTK